MSHSLLTLRPIKGTVVVVTQALGASAYIHRIGAVVTFFESPSTLFALASDLHGQPGRDDLVIERAGAGSWRVCDRRVACGEGRFVAFIDEKDDAFEVMEISDDFLWTTFPTMVDALAHVADTCDQALPTHATKRQGRHR